MKFLKNILFAIVIIFSLDIKASEKDTKSSYQFHKCKVVCSYRDDIYKKAEKVELKKPKILPTSEILLYSHLCELHAIETGRPSAFLDLFFNKKYNDFMNSK